MVRYGADGPPKAPLSRGGALESTAGCSAGATPEASRELAQQAITCWRHRDEPNLADVFERLRPGGAIHG